jgi:hypothetical protein
MALVRMSGDVTGNDIARCAAALQADPDWCHHCTAIWDDREVNLLDVSPDGLRQMVDVQASGETGPDLIVTQLPDRTLLMDLYARLVEIRGRPAAVFSTLDEALAHVGRDALPPRLQSFAHEPLV